jgi:hypothetical protein
MRRRLRWAAAALAAAASVVLTAAPAPARTASVVLTAAPAPAQAASGWRIDKVFGQPHYLLLQAIAASGADNAWLLGLTPTPEPAFVTQRWNGSRWASVALPRRLRFVAGPWALYSGIYSTSPSDTWFFPVLPDRMTPVQYALWWNGSAWTTSEVTARPDTVLDAAVFGSRNVWTFGEADVPFPSYGPAVVRRWNGTVWRTVSVPVGTPVNVDGVAPDDIWALGASRATVHRARQAIIAMHWNGKAWSALRLPTFTPVKSGHPWVATAITAAGPRDAWVAETPAASQRTGLSPPGLILLHWNGSTWHTVARNRTLRGVTGLTPDGHGGFWLTATDPASPRASDIVDYHNGTFTSQPAPARRGYTSSVSGIFAVPGTGSSWATGALTPVKAGAAKTDILRYTP